MKSFEQFDEMQHHPWVKMEEFIVEWLTERIWVQRQEVVAKIQLRYDRSLGPISFGEGPIEEVVLNVIFLCNR
jgi:hypothetical protein